MRAENGELSQAGAPGAAGPRSKLMKSKSRIALVATLAVSAGAALFAWKHSASGSGADAAELTLYGNVDMREAQLAFNGVGRIEAILIEEGARVAKGQLLAVMDRRHLKAAMDRAVATLGQQRHRLADLKAGARPAEINAARARVDAARARSIHAAGELFRKEHLLGGAVSPQQRDQAKAEADIAVGNLREAEESLKLLLEGPRSEAVASAEGQVQADEAELASARHRFDDASLYAPAEGVLHNRLLQPGEMASPDRNVLSLALTRPLWVRAYVEEPKLGRVRPGAEAWISTDSRPDKAYKGWIGFISPTAEFTPRAVETSEVRTELVYELRIFVCDGEGELRLGMPATIRIPPAQGENAPPGADAACSSRS